MELEDLEDFLFYPFNLYMNHTRCQNNIVADQKSINIKMYE